MNLAHDKLLSSFAFKCKLRHYTADNEDGTYGVKYTLTGSGFYTIKLNHPSAAGFFEQIVDRTVMLRTAPAPIGLESYAEGPGLSSDSETCSVKQVQTFSIKLKDRYLNNITVGDASAFQVRVATGYGPFYDFTRSRQDVLPKEMSFPLEDEVAAYEAANPFSLVPCVYYEAGRCRLTPG